MADGWKKAEERATHLGKLRALIFLKEAKLSLGAVLISEELQQSPAVHTLWRDASCPPYRW